MATSSLLVNEWKLSEIGTTFAIDENALVRALLRLDALRIIEFRPPKRVKRLTARNFSWRSDGPVHEFFVTRVVPQFLVALTRVLINFTFLAACSLLLPQRG